MSRVKSFQQTKELKAKSFSPVVETSYRLKRDDKGNCLYTDCGSIDVQQNINSYKNGCSLASMLERMSFMPVRDKISYLSQTEDGQSVDMSAFPKDGTEAFIMANDVVNKHPELVEKVRNGESFDKAFNELYSAKEEKIKENEREVINDGEN